jgi:hypothetical protein
MTGCLSGLSSQQACFQLKIIKEKLKPSSRPADLLSIAEHWTSLRPFRTSIWIRITDRGSKIIKGPIRISWPLFLKLDSMA